MVTVTAFAELVMFCRQVFCQDKVTAVDTHKKRHLDGEKKANEGSQVCTYLF